MKRQTSKFNLLRVLLIEDHAEIASMMIATLGMLGHRTTWSQTLAEAVSQVSHAPFDVILADYSLPDGTALDLVPLLGTLHISTPIVLLTAHDLDFFSPFERTGFSVFIQKPVGFDDLADALQTAMESKAITVA